MSEEFWDGVTVGMLTMAAVVAWFERRTIQRKFTAAPLRRKLVMTQWIFAGVLMQAARWLPDGSPIAIGAELLLMVWWLGILGWVAWWGISKFADVGVRVWDWWDRRLESKSDEDGELVTMGETGSDE